jgi:membrane-associated phospholipid phosphatase
MKPGELSNNPLLRHGLMAAPLAGWALFQWAHDAFRLDHLLAALLALFLAFKSDRTRDFLRGFYPIALYGILFDGLRYLPDPVREAGHIHDCDLRDLELGLFGVGDGVGRETLHPWMHAHQSAALDLLCAIPYAGYLYGILGLIFYFYARDRARMTQLTWAFVLLYVIGAITQRAFPAAPPWYYAQHGCLIDPAAAPSSAGLLRVDELLGVGYFKSFYSRSTVVFGALPSLHMATATLTALVAWPLVRGPWRFALLLYPLWMGFAAIYLDHHWVVDLVVGTAFAIGSWGVVQGVEAIRQARTLAPAGRSSPMIR